MGHQGVSAAEINEDDAFWSLANRVKRLEVDADGCHTLVSYTYLPPEDQALPSNFPVQIEDIAIGLMSGRNEFYDVVHETVLRYAPKGLLIEVPGKCPCSFRAAFNALKAYHPNAKWYYVSDEDVMIDLAQLTGLLSKLDSSQPVLLAGGGGNQVCRVCGVCPPILMQNGLHSSHAFYGGTGQILSAGFIKAIEPILSEVCAQAVMNTLNNYGDLENTCSIVRSWAPHYKYFYLHKNTTTAADFMSEAPRRYVTAHHICPKHLRNLSYVNSHMQAVRKSLVMITNAVNNGCTGFEKKG